jgi:hypothetical protein
MEITQEQLQELRMFINGIPTQYGMPLLIFLERLEYQQKVDEQPSESEEMDT